MIYWKENRLYLFTLFVLVLVGGFLRFYNLGNIILYWDEPLHCIRIASQPLPFVLAYNNASAFFALLVHFLLPLGKIELMARLPSALLGTLSIVAIFFLGKLLFSKREGLAAAAFIAFSPFLIRYSQYSRAYSTFAFFILVSFYFFIRALRENKTKFWISFLIITALGIYTHLFALLLLPAYGIFTVAYWLKEKKKVKIKKFILWTLALLILVSVLYIPDVNIRNFLYDSLSRTKAQPADSSASISLISEITWRQLELKNIFFYWLFLLSAFIGFASGLKKHFWNLLFILTCILIPFIIFIAIKPREVNIASADRYFIFFLPLIFLLTAKGIIYLSQALAPVFAKIKWFRWNKNLATGIIFGLFLSLMIGWGFNFKHYYLNFWRLGSVSINREVRDFLELNVKEDSLIYLDFFPASHLVMVANPLTKNLTTREIEHVIRKKTHASGKKHQVMIYRISEGVFQWFASDDVGLWSVASLNSQNQEKLVNLVSQYPEVEIFHLKNHVILHFKKNRTPLASKLSTMTDIFLSLDIPPAKRKTYNLLAARVNLYNDRIEQAYQNLNEARAVILKPEEAKIPGSPFIFQFLDALFGLTNSELRTQSRSFFFDAGISRQLYRMGNRLLVQRKLEEAERAYSECLALKSDYSPKVASRLIMIGDRYATLELYKKAVVSYSKALKLNPSRCEINFLLAEAYMKEGSLKEAKKAYKQAFNLSNLSPGILNRIVQSPNLVIIWENNSIWHLLFKSKVKTEFNGYVQGSKKIQNTRKFRILKDDSLEVLKNKIHFSLRLNRKKIKLLVFEVPQKSSLTFDIKTNGERKLKTILLLGRTKSPEKMPFTIR